MTDLEIQRTIRSSLKDFMRTIGCVFINDPHMVFYSREEKYKDKVAFTARNRTKFKNNTEYQLSVSYFRRFVVIESLWQEYYGYVSKQAEESFSTFGIKTTNQPCLDIPAQLIIDKNNPEVLSKCQDYIINTYKVLKKKIQTLSSFAMLDALYNSSMPCFENYAESGPAISEMMLFRRIIIAYNNNNPEFEQVYRENREVLIRLKERFQKQKERYEKALHVYDDIYRRIQAGEIEKAQTLI